MISARVSVQSKVSSSTVCSIKMGKIAAGGTPSSWVGVLGEGDKLSNGSESFAGRIAKDTPEKEKPQHKIELWCQPGHESKLLESD